MSDAPGMNTAMLDYMTRLQTQAEDAPREPLPQRSAEEMQWLRNALATVEQPEQRTKKILDFLEQDGPTVEQRADALEELADLVEDINIATEYALMKGPERLLAFIALPTRTAEERQWAAMTIGQSAQNHEKVQRQYTEAQWAPVLLPLLHDESVKAARSALLLAVGCLARNEPSSTAHFIEKDGMATLLHVLTNNADDVKSVCRALRLVLFLAEEVAVAAIPVAVKTCDFVHVEGAEEAACTTLAAMLKRDTAELKSAVAEKLSSWVRDVRAQSTRQEWEDALLAQL